MDEILTFDRTDDVSKLEGCNTRGVEYRWDIFTKRLDTIPLGSHAIDFGAGSLRESFDLVRRGFNVTSIDIDGVSLSTYKEMYNWPANAAHEIIANHDPFVALSELGDHKYSLITCFDVLEHLSDPVSALKELSKYMDDGALLFITVPNGRTLFELAFRLDLTIARATKRPLRPGEPHLQRNSPARWRCLISEAGLFVLDHEMQIGFFANTSAALIQLPLAFGGRVARKLGFNINALELSKRICNGPQASVMDFLDRHTKPILSGLYGWNLFVLAKAPA